jgi:hypothetical protein
MNAKEEYDAWANYMRSRRGTWTIDPIHDGTHRDLLAFLPDRLNPEVGVYVSAHGRTIEAGRYFEGFPHVTDGEFKPLYGVSMLVPFSGDDKHGTAPPVPEVMKTVIERLGVAFLLGVLCNVPG